MSDKKEYTDLETQEICNDSLRAAITCAEKGQPPCATCQLMEECKKTKEELDELWKTKW